MHESSYIWHLKRSWVCRDFIPCCPNVAQATAGNLAESLNAGVARSTCWCLPRFQTWQMHPSNSSCQTWTLWFVLFLFLYCRCVYLSAGSSPCKHCSAGILMTQGFCGWHVEVGDCRTLEKTQLKASRLVRMFLQQWFSPSFWVWYSWRFNQATCLMGYSWDAVWLSGTPGQRKMMWMGGWYVHWLKVVVAFQVRLRRATLPRISVHQYMISHLPMTFR